MTTATDQPRAGYPIRLLVTDDLDRTRLTVAFRIILVIPHMVWLWLWGVLAVFLWPVAWIWTLAAGAAPGWAHGFYARLLRYGVHVSSYLHLAADPYPKFANNPGYPVDLAVDDPRPQRRAITLFRLLLAIPMLFVASVLQNLQQIVAVIAWFVILFTGRMPEGMRNIITFCIAFSARTYGYVAFLTDRYPPFSEREFPTS